MRLRTARLDQQPFTLDDVDAAHRLWTNPSVRRHLWDDIVIPRERAEEAIMAGIASFRKDRFGLWGAWLRHAGPLIGFTGLRFVDETPEVELLYGLLPEYWGRGLATEAAEAVLDYGFRELDLPRLVGRTDPPNSASVRVLERLGMTLATRASAGGQEALCYSIDRERFLATRSPPAAVQIRPPSP